MSEGEKRHASDRHAARESDSDDLVMHRDLASLKEPPEIIVSKGTVQREGGFEEKGQRR